MLISSGRSHSEGHLSRSWEADCEREAADVCKRTVGITCSFYHLSAADRWRALQRLAFILAAEDTC